MFDAITLAAGDLPSILASVDVLHLALEFTENDAGTATDTPLFGMLQAVSTGVAVLVAIFGLFKVLTSAFNSRVGEAMKGLLITIVVCAVLFDLSLVPTTINLAGDLVAAGIQSVGDLLGGGGDAGAATGELQPQQ